MQYATHKSHPERTSLCVPLLFIQVSSFEYTKNACSSWKKSQNSSWLLWGDWYSVLPLMWVHTLSTVKINFNAFSSFLSYMIVCLPISDLQPSPTLFFFKQAVAVWIFLVIQMSTFAFFFPDPQDAFFLRLHHGWMPNTVYSKCLSTAMLCNTTKSFQTWNSSPSKEKENLSCCFANFLINY